MYVSCAKTCLFWVRNSSKEHHGSQHNGNQKRADALLRAPAYMCGINETKGGKLNDSTADQKQRLIKKWERMGLNRGDCRRITWTHTTWRHTDVLGAPTHTQSGGGFLLVFAALKVRDEDHGSS